MEKIPCIKCTPKLWEHIKPYLEGWGYDTSSVTNSWYACPTLVINSGGDLGKCCNFSVPGLQVFNRELVTEVREFLERAAKLRGYKYKPKNIIMDMTVINGIEITPGMGIYLHNTTAENLYIVIPTKNGLAVVAYGQSCTWLNIRDFILRYMNDIVAICDLPHGQSIEGEFLWKKPEKIVLTLQEIADKLNVPLEYLRVEGIDNDKCRIFSSDDVKPGMIVEISHCNTLSLGMVTYGDNNRLCISGPNYWAPLDVFNRVLLITHTGTAITKVYSQAPSQHAYTLSTKGRQLLWDRRYTRLYNLRDLAEAFGVPMEQIEIRK